MSWVRIWIHLVFSTKNNEPYLNSAEVRNTVYRHVQQNAEEKNIRIDSINGYHNHVHCLVSLSKDQAISKIVQLIKGESSNWINRNKIIKTKFNWQDDYWAVSVSESHLVKVRKYILSQEEHHKRSSFAEEVDVFMKKYGWQFIKG